MLYKKRYAGIALLVCVLSVGAQFLAGGCRNKKKKHKDEQKAVAVSITQNRQSPGPLLWAKKAGGPGQEGPGGMDIFPDGSAIIAGICQNNAVFGQGEPTEKTIISPSIINSFLARYNPDGTFVWVAYTEGTYNVVPCGTNRIYLHSDGSITALGIYMMATVIFAPGEANETVISIDPGPDTIAARYNPDGSLAWAKIIGQHEEHFSESLTNTSMFVAGRFENSFVFGAGESNETILTSTGGTDVCLAKYNIDGTLAWAKSAGGTGNDSTYEIHPLEDDSIIMLAGISENGGVFGKGEMNETAISNSSQVLARYNPDGTLAWARAIFPYYYDITAAADGSVYMTGDFYTEIVFGEGEKNETILIPKGYFDIFIAKYNSNGSFAWAKRVGDYGFSAGLRITGYVDSSAVVAGYIEEGTIFGAGEFYQTTLKPEEPQGSGFMAKYNPNGSLAWAKLANQYNDNLSAMTDGTLYSSGRLYGTVIFGKGDPNETSLTETPPGYGNGGDIFISKYNP